MSAPRGGYWRGEIGVTSREVRFGPTERPIDLAYVQKVANQILADAGLRKESAMTTTVKVHVNGQYRATVKQDGGIPVTIEGNYNGGSGEKSFLSAAPSKSHL